MQKILFNENWTFMEGSGSGLFSALVGGEQKPQRVNLPHDAVIGTKRVKEPGLGAVGFYKSGNVCYTKSFTAPEEWRDKAVWIEFEGIFQNALIYVNNAYAGTAFYGYGGHFFDIRRFLSIGRKNEIRVTVKNGGNPAGRWYTGGGIYRDVNLYIGNPLHILCTGTRVCTESVEADQAAIRVITPLVHDGNDTVTAFVKNEILDSDGNTVAEETLPITFFDHEPKELRQRLVVANPHLWDTESPYLYTVCTTVSVDGDPIDSYTSTFGIRYMQLDARKGLRINGKTVKLRGGCIHHDNGVVGAATFEASEERRVRIMKQMGYNAIRMAHHPVSKAMLRACDRLGMYIMDEFSDVWSSTKAEFDYGIHFSEQFERDVVQMVYKDFNHPSVILYSIGNEIPEVGNRFDVSFGRKIVEIIRSLDDTRYILNSMNIMLAVMPHMDEVLASLGVSQGETAGGEINNMMASLGDAMSAMSTSAVSSRYIEEACGQVDICGYNYAEDRYPQDAAQYPNRIMMGSETFPAKLAKNWALIEKYPNVLGDFVWTSWDYLGEAGIGENTYEGDQGSPIHMNSWPLRIAMCGTINLLGVPQPVAYWRQIVWGLRKEPYINVCPPDKFGRKVIRSAWGWSDGQATWTWEGSEGKPVDVEVYTDADEAELFVNGKSLGRKPVGEEYPFTACFQAVYEPGEICAVCYKGSEQTAFQLKTASAQVQLDVCVENPLIRPITDLGYIDIRLVDGNGILNPCADALVHVEVEGGTLQGLGSADPSSDELFTGNECASYRGALLAVVRAEQPGRITVKITADGYEPRAVELTAK